MINKNMAGRWGAALAFSATSLCVGTTNAAVIRVDDDASPGGDGSTWETAFNSLRDALAVAQAGDEIRVAQGVYRPDAERGDRSVSFQLVGDAALKGGYAGLDATDPDERNIDRFPTILSGDLGGNDGPGFSNNGENSWHVVNASNVGPATVLSGVTIIAGNANGSQLASFGGGLFNMGGSPTIERCCFKNNMASEGGGGLANIFSANATLVECTLIGNAAQGPGLAVGGALLDAAGAATTLQGCLFTANLSSGFGGGCGIQESTPTFVDCVFTENHATAGGGLISLDAAFQVIRCVFDGNRATSFAGGAMALISETGPSAEVANTLFINNSAFDGGAVATNGGSHSFTNCTLSMNVADERLGGEGGGFFDAGGASSTIRNSIVWGNIPDEIVAEPGSTPVVEYCDVMGGWEGIGNVDITPGFVDPRGDWRLNAGSPVIDAADSGALAQDVIADLAGNPRYDDDPCTTDTGVITPMRFPLDMGAYEFVPPCPADLDCSGQVDIGDLMGVIRDYGACGWCLTDQDGNGVVDVLDLLAVLAAWGPCTPEGT